MLPLERPVLALALDAVVRVDGEESLCGLLTCTYPVYLPLRFLAYRFSSRRPNLYTLCSLPSRRPYASLLRNSLSISIRVSRTIANRFLHFTFRAT